MAMSVLLSRFFMSLLARDSSSTLACSSWLTVCSSSFSDCISSLEVVSSSLVLCSSSLVDCSSSLADLSSSWEVCISSRVDLQLLARLLELLLQRRQAGAAADARAVLPDGLASGGVATSAKTIITIPRSASGSGDRLDGDVHGLHPAVGPHLHALQATAALLCAAPSGRRCPARRAAPRGPWRRCSSWPCRPPAPGTCPSAR